MCMCLVLSTTGSNAHKVVWKMDEKVMSGLVSYDE